MKAALFPGKPDPEIARVIEDAPTELMKILSTLFSEEIPFQKKVNRLTELGIVVTEEMREGINVMCNLSEGIYERGRADERA